MEDDLRAAPYAFGRRLREAQRLEADDHPNAHPEEIERVLRVSPFVGHGVQRRQHGLVVTTQDVPIPVDHKGGVVRLTAARRRLRTQDACHSVLRASRRNLGVDLIEPIDGYGCVGRSNVDPIADRLCLGKTQDLYVP